MSEVSGAVTAVESRQSMIRVWLAMSAVWVAFWLLITGLFVSTMELGYPFEANLASFATIILTPPLALFAIGVAARFTFARIEYFKQARITR